MQHKIVSLRFHRGRLALCAWAVAVAQRRETKERVIRMIFRQQDLFASACLAAWHRVVSNRRLAHVSGIRATQRWALARWAQVRAQIVALEARALHHRLALAWAALRRAASLHGRLRELSALRYSSLRERVWVHWRRSAEMRPRMVWASTILLHSKLILYFRTWARRAAVLKHKHLKQGAAVRFMLSNTWRLAGALFLHWRAYLEHRQEKQRLTTRALSFWCSETKSKVLRAELSRLLLRSPSLTSASHSLLFVVSNLALALVRRSVT